MRITHGGLYLGPRGNDDPNGREEAVFSGPVSMDSGFLTAGGDSRAIFFDAVNLNPGGIHLTGRASVTLGGRMTIVAGLVKVTGGNRLIFSLSPSGPADGFVHVDGFDDDKYSPDI